MNRKGFAYIIAVLILGLLAFMGMFLAQSSTAEYSQAAFSVYATMAQQLAEAAADEAFLEIEKGFRDGSAAGKKGPLLRQAATSNYIDKGGTTGLNPSLLDILPDFKGYVIQTNWLISNHLTRAGFEIESVKPELTDCRPVDSRPYNLPECVYNPKDRPKATRFDNPASKDFYLTVTFKVTVALKHGTKRHKFFYQCARDLKIINVGPIGRAHTMFSAMGVDIRNQGEIMNDLSLGKGRLVLWNLPFQSRVYIHGPAVIGIENIDWDPLGDPRSQGAYASKDPNGRPGPNQAFQYSTTHNGFSYLPFPLRALWEPKKVWGSNDGVNNTMEDVRGGGDAKIEQMLKYNTYVKGLIPKAESSFWGNLGELMSSGGWANKQDYCRGRRIKQVFLPAGPYCRTPWKYIPDRRPGNYSPNQIPEAFPDPDNMLRLEHRFLDEDGTFEDKTKVYAEMNYYRIEQISGIRYMQAGYPQKTVKDFAMIYGNHRDPEGVWEKFKTGFAKVVGFVGNAIMSMPNVIISGGEALWNTIFKPSDPAAPASMDERDHRNFYPTNFKVFYRSATMKLKDANEIPRDKDGVWILDGLYWMDTFETRGPVLYRGKGMIFVGAYNQEKPFTIRGDILRDPEHRDESHLTLVYYPFTRDSSGQPRLPDLDRCQLIIEGVGHTIEASVFSLAGIRTTEGSLTDMDYVNFKMDPSKPPQFWRQNVNLGAFRGKVNTIVGNYVNYFVKKSRLDGDLWVIHDNNNPLYFTKDAAPLLKETYSEADEIAVHTVQMSPKIQHLHFSGGIP